MQIKLTSILRSLSVLAIPLAVQPQQRAGEPMLIANYHATFRAAEQFRQMKGQAKVRDTRHFPIAFDDFRALITVTQISPKQYEADLIIEEKDGSIWRSINLDAVSFQSSFATPTEFQWVKDQYSLELAIAVSPVTD